MKFVNGELLVFHDDEVDRLTNSTGVLEGLSRADIQALRLKNGEPIPTLSQIWDIVPPSIGINIELKGPGTGAPVAEFIKTHSHRYLISSFFENELDSFKQQASAIPTALLTRIRDEDLLASGDSLAVDNLHVMDSVADTDYIQPMLNAGFTVCVFTVNDVERAIELKKQGVAAVFTDVPRRFMANRKLNDRG